MKSGTNAILAGMNYIGCMIMARAERGLKGGIASSLQRRKILICDKTLEYKNPNRHILICSRTIVYNNVRGSRMEKTEDANHALDRVSPVKFEKHFEYSMTLLDYHTIKLIHNNLKVLINLLRTRAQ
mmetsp:Transcript_5635/g.8353  ORF Transcript_5635/g.8353 Transcript_5635/m.8353 type:complete len:127 (+) Transcript_5635:683-1063(+)